jgi:hypothetical protein
MQLRKLRRKQLKTHLRKRKNTIGKRNIMSWFNSIVTEMKKILNVGDIPVDLKAMTKIQLEDYGRSLGVELDRRLSKKKLIAKLESL